MKKKNIVPFGIWTCRMNEIFGIRVLTFFRYQREFKTYESLQQYHSNKCMMKKQENFHNLLLRLPVTAPANAAASTLTPSFSISHCTSINCQFDECHCPW